MNSLLLNLSSALNLLTPCCVKCVSDAPQIACSLAGSSEKKALLCINPVGLIDPMTKPGLSSHGPGLVASPWRNKMESTRMCQTCELESSVLRHAHMCRALRPCHSAVLARLENKASMRLICASSFPSIIDCSDAC